MLKTLHQEKRAPLSISRIAEFLSVNRTSLYYEKKPPSEEEIKAKHRIDELHTEHPAWGSRQLSKQLKISSFNIGRRKTSVL